MNLRARQLIATYVDFCSWEVACFHSNVANTKVLFIHLWWKIGGGSVTSLVGIFLKNRSVRKFETRWKIKFSFFTTELSKQYIFIDWNRIFNDPHEWSKEKYIDTISRSSNITLFRRVDLTKKKKRSSNEISSMRNAVHVKSWLTYIHGAREIVDDAWRQRASAGSSQAPPIPLHLAASCHYGGLHPRPCSPPLLLCILAPRQPFRYRHCHLLSTGACAQLCTAMPAIRYDHGSMEHGIRIGSVLDRLEGRRDSSPTRL